MEGEQLPLGGGRRVRLLQVLGEGGFGVVYRGELTSGAGMVKAVAVKVLKPSAAEVPELASRLRDEARVLALLRHRAIVGVEDLVEVGGRWALVMEYIQGVDLEHLMAQGVLPGRPTCEVLLEAASALHAAHGARHPGTGEELQLVHRDIKPGNIRITTAGEVKLLDFGVARARFAGREAETRDLTFGSAGYMAPERWEGRELPASDVYALGIVGIEALTGTRLGQLPVEAGRHAARLHGALGAVEPPELRALLAAMTDYFAEERPTAGEVVRRLRGMLVVVEGPWLAEWAPEAVGSIRPVDTSPLGAEPSGTIAKDASGTMASDAERGGRPGWWLLGAVLVGLLGVLLVGGATVGGAGAAWFFSRGEAPADPAPASIVEPSLPDPAPVPEVEPEVEPDPAPVAAPIAEPAPLPRPVVAPARPLPAPVPTPPPLVLTGEVVVDGPGVRQVVLRDRSGATSYPGVVAVGTYVAEVAFDDGVQITIDGVEVRASEATTLRCSALAQTCTVR